MKRKRFCKSIGLFIILLLTGCSQSKTEEVFYQTSPLTIFEEGFGLSAEEFFSLFPAEGYQDWEQTRETEHLIYPPYTEYLAPEQIEFAGYPCQIWLRFYDDYGLGNYRLVYNTEDTGDELDIDSYYQMLTDFYLAVSDLFGNIDEDVSWRACETAEQLQEYFDNGGGDTKTTGPMRSVSATWPLSNHLHGDPYSQNVYLSSMIDWPVTGTIIKFQIDRDTSSLRVSEQDSRYA